MKTRVCVVVAVEFTLRAFLVHHLRSLGSKYDLTVVINTSNSHLLDELGISGKLFSIPIKRKISLWSDLASLIKILIFFKRENFTIVHSITPKAGLLAAIAGSINAVPIRIHTFTGQVWASKVGFGRSVLKFFDFIMARLVTHVLVDSRSQLEFLLRESIIPIGKARVLGEGSISGVDLNRFAPNPKIRREFRSREKVKDDQIIFLFLGRLTRDKGVLDLAKAFLNVARQYKTALLWLVGPDEEEMTVEIKIICDEIKERVQFFGLTLTPESFMAAADVLCLPSYREGFGNVIIEAAAVGIPAIGSRIYGIIDAIEDGVTGLLHIPASPDDLACKMIVVAANDSLRRDLGLKARDRVNDLFSSQALKVKYIEFYEELLQN